MDRDAAGLALPKRDGPWERVESEEALLLGRDLGQSRGVPISA
jgi:hypothetical protein